MGDGRPDGRPSGPPTGSVDLGVRGLVDAVPIGKGGFATVYRAWQPDYDRSVAVKIFHEQLTPETQVRFDRERRLLGKLSNHPNIVTVLDSGIDAHIGGYTRPYLVMEYMQGGSLAESIAIRGRLDWPEAAEIGVRIAGAVEAAHRADVLHRDIKPDNVLLSAYGEPKLADFGIARPADDVTVGETVTASIAHTAPEVWDGARQSPQTDVYALASTLYMTLTGRAPFERYPDETEVNLITRILRSPTPVADAPGIPPGMVNVLFAAMTRDTRARIDSAALFGTMLQRIQSDAGVGITPLRVDPLRAAQGGPLGTAANATTVGKRRRASTIDVVPPPVMPRRHVARTVTFGVLGITAAMLAVTVVAVLLRSPPGPADFAWRRPVDVARAGDRLWIVDAASGQLIVVEAAAPDIPVARFDVGRDPRSVAIGDGRVMAAGGRAGTVSVIHPDTNAVTASAMLDSNVTDVIGVGDEIWATLESGGEVAVLDMATMGELRRIDVGDKPNALTAAAGAVWVANTGHDTVTRIDLRSGMQNAIPVGSAPVDLAAGSGAIWVANSLSNIVTRIDLSDSSTTNVLVPVRPTRLGIDGDAVWVLGRDEAALVAIDARTEAPVPGGRIDLPAGTRAFIVQDGLLWLVSESGISRQELAFDRPN